MNLKYVQKAGDRYRYRRKVPQGLRAALGKGEIITPLGRSEAEVAMRYPAAHAAAEREVAEALHPPRPKPVVNLTDLQQFQAAERQVRQRGFDPQHIGAGTEEWFARGNVADAILSKYPLDEEGDPIGVSTRDELVVRLLYGGSREPRPAPTLQDAIDLYRKEKVQGDHRKAQQLDAVFRLVGDILSPNTKLSALRKDGAKEVRDHMLEGRAPSSVDRYLNVIRAVINYANDQLDIENPRNPFMKLEAAPKDKAEPERSRRKPFPEKELVSTRQRIMSLASPDLQLIWRMLEGTGCRLNEVAGLRVEDLHLDHKIPHISVEWHEKRRIKNAVSRRNVPLIGDALDAAKEALRQAHGKTEVFERYCREGGNGAASAALGKHVRACVTDRKVTTHSLRHRMKDLLDLAGVSDTDRYLVLGHSTGNVGDNYGGDEVRLKVAHRALQSALSAQGKTT